MRHRHRLSFRVMTDRRMREALAFDHDFAAAGFVEVRPGGGSAGRERRR